MRKYKLKRLVVFLSIIFFMMPSMFTFADEINKVNEGANIKSGERYESIKFGDSKFSKNIYDENEKQEVKEKIEAMKDYKILKTKTDANFEVSLAYSNGSYSYIDNAETLDEAMEKVRVLEETYNDDIIIPALINKDGQVIYATNSMGRVWNHRNGEPIQGSSEITYLYSNPTLGSAFTYINQGYVDDVPIIEDLGYVAKIQVSSYSGWIDKDSASGNYDLVVVPINQVTDPSCYLVKDGELYHYISKNMTSSGISGSSIRLGIAPSYMKEGVDYYSYDGVYFYEGLTIADGLNKLVTDLKNNTNERAINHNKPHYNYYGYLPFRTKTNYTAEEINRFINNETVSWSKLRGLGEVLIECQNKYGVNPILALGVAINESNWGKSDIAQEKNNIFGINAVDVSPGESADSFETAEDSVREFTKNYISRGYSDPADWRYFGGYLGNKQLGANVKYASDPFWGEKAAQHAFSIDYELSNGDIENLKDYNGYQLATYTGANEVINVEGNLLYNINPTVSGWGGYLGNIVALKFNELTTNGKYEIFPERTTPLNNGGDENKYHGNYEWNNKSYVNNSNIELINTTKDQFIPGYFEEDVDRNGQVDIEDLAKVSVEYNKTSEESSFKKYLDINMDGIIDIFDLVIIGKKI